MKKLYIYDSYRKVYNPDNTLLFSSSSFTDIDGEFESLEEAVQRANIIYRDFKTLGDITLDNPTLSAEGKYTVEIMLPTGRRVQRIIFVV